MCSKRAFFDFYDFFKDKKSQFSKANLGYLDNFLGGMHKSKVAQNPKICRKPVEFFDLSILCALKVHF